MPSRTLEKNDKKYLVHLGKKVAHRILTELGYRSLDAFAMEHSKLITKPTLYEVCAGKRDMKVSTLRGLAKALKISYDDLVQERPRDTDG